MNFKRIDCIFGIANIDYEHKFKTTVLQSMCRYPVKYSSEYLLNSCIHDFSLNIIK